MGEQSIAALDSLETARYYTGLEMLQLAFVSAQHWRDGRKYFYLSTYYLWRTEKWRELLDSGGQPFQFHGDHLRDLSAQLADMDVQVSVNAMHKTLSDMRVYETAGLSPALALNLTINARDEIRRGIEFDRETGEVKRLSQAAETNLPLPEGTDQERVSAYLQDIAELPESQMIRLAQDVNGKVLLVYIPAEYRQDDAGMWHISGKLVDADSGELHATVAGTASTVEGYKALMKRTYGASE